MNTPITLSASDPSDRWRHHQDAVTAWLAANGLDANSTTSVTVHGDRIDAVEILRDADGHPYRDPARKDCVATRRVTVPLAAALPAELVKALRP